MWKADFWTTKHIAEFEIGGNYSRLQKRGRFFQTAFHRCDKARKLKKLNKLNRGRRGKQTGFECIVSVVPCYCYWHVIGRCVGSQIDGFQGRLDLSKSKRCQIPCDRLPILSFTPRHRNTTWFTPRHSRAKIAGPPIEPPITICSMASITGTGLS